MVLEAGHNDLAALRLNCPVLETPRLMLRPPHESDAEDIAELANNYRVASMLASMPHPYFVADAREFLGKFGQARDGHAVYAITLKQDGTFIGVCGLHEDTKRYELPFIGYWLGETYWGHGFASEAARALVDVFFKVTDRDEMMISCRFDNERSRRVIEKCGGIPWKREDRYNRALGEMQAIDDFRVTRESWLRVAGQA
jgi:RimJ/RimL family protein N-acetyltransferase